MIINNHVSSYKSFANGFQITFPNKYTVIVKNGLNAKCTQSKKDDDPTAMMMASRFGGTAGPDVEVEVYDTKNSNITDKFGEPGSLGFITPIQLVNLLYVVSSLR
jgi:hypothetical protein